MSSTECEGAHRRGRAVRSCRPLAGALDRPIQAPCSGSLLQMTNGAVDTLRAGTTGAQRQGRRVAARAGDLPRACPCA